MHSEICRQLSSGDYTASEPVEFAERVTTGARVGERKKNEVDIKTITERFCSVAQESRPNGQPWCRRVVIFLVWAGVFALVLLGLIFWTAAWTGFMVRY
jgi:hypothetical protein